MTNDPTEHDATRKQMRELVAAGVALYQELQLVELPDGESIGTFPRFAAALHALPETHRHIAELKGRIAKSLGLSASQAEPNIGDVSDDPLTAIRASDLLPLVIRRIEPFVTAFRLLRQQWEAAGYTEPDDNGMLVGPDVTVGAYRRLCDLHRDLTGIVIDNAVTQRWKLVPTDLLTDLLSASRATSEDEWLSGVARVAEDLAVNALTFTAPPPAEVAGILALLATLQDPEREWPSLGERLEESLSTGRAAAGLIARLASARVAAEAGANVAATGPTSTFQTRVHNWMMACFGPTISADTIERNHCFLEEALELVQACGCTAADAHQLVDYVFGRPVGERHQEVGGVMVTLAALCLAQGLDMHEAGETELARNWTKVQQIRAKQAAKPKGSPLPEPVAQQPQPAPAAAAALVAWLDKRNMILPDDPARLVPVPASLLRRLRSADSGGGAQQPAQAQQPAGTPPLVFGYTNYRGEHGIRRVQPIRVFFGATEHHPEPQWLMEAMDLDKGSIRVFAMRDMQDQQPTGGVPDGWKLVPDGDNLTDEMAEAIAELARCCGGIALDIWRAALSAAPTPPAAEGWAAPRPIGEAPKDGRPLLLWGLRSGGNAGDREWIVSRWLGSDLGMPHWDGVLSPTGYAPLPAPPTAGGAVMTCSTCGRGRVWHGSEKAQPGTVLAETGCHDGVAMDDDAYANGWQPDVIYPPCPHNPARCMACSGSGYAVDPEAAGQDDCQDCRGTGWRGGEQPRWLLRTATSAGEC